MGRCVANVSWGKDSTAMLHLLLESGAPLDEVVFYDTGMEFGAVYAERDRMLPLLREAGVAYVELRPRNPMWWDMLCRPVRSRSTGEVRFGGYGWCGGPCRWGTSAKTAALDRHSRGAESVYIGIAVDEAWRVKDDPRKKYPLVEAGMTETDCMELCYRRGHTWEEDGVHLYDVLDRVSCWCCRNKNLKELAAMRESLPSYYDKLVALEKAIGEPMKRRALAERGE